MKAKLPEGQSEIGQNVAPCVRKLYSHVLWRIWVCHAYPHDTQSKSATG